MRMEFGIFHEFLTTQTGSEAEAFAQSFAQIEAAESWGLDVVWLAEIHMNPTRSLLSAPLTVASAIAARTHRIKIGTAVQILPLGHPLRLAEETATIDQISGGRLIFGVGRSAFSRAYNAYGISYEESQDRFAESLDIIKTAWTQPNASYRGRYHSFDNFTLVPRPLQRPHPGNPHRRQPARDLCDNRRARLSAVLGGARQPADRTRLPYQGLSRGLGRGRPSERAARVPAGANLRRPDARGRAGGCARGYDAALDVSRRSDPGGR
jgi:hypothetical protein